MTCRYTTVSGVKGNADFELASQSDIFIYLEDVVVGFFFFSSLFEIFLQELGVFRFTCRPFAPTI